jgi:hypothetical protein
MLKTNKFGFAGVTSILKECSALTESVSEIQVKDLGSILTKFEPATMVLKFTPEVAPVFEFENESDDTKEYYIEFVDIARVAYSSNCDIQEAHASVAECNGLKVDDLKVLVESSSSISKTIREARLSIKESSPVRKHEIASSLKLYCEQILALENAGVKIYNRVD